MAGSEAGLIAALKAFVANPQTLPTQFMAIHDNCAAMARAGRSSSDPVLSDAMGILEAMFPQHAGNKEQLTHVMLLLTAIAAVRDGRMPALAMLVRAYTDPRLQDLDPDLAFAALDKWHWFEGFDKDAYITLTADIGPVYQPDDTHAGFAALRVLRVLGLRGQTDLEKLRPIFEGVALPWLKDCLDKEYYNAALSLENSLYTGWLRRHEIMDHYDESYRLWAPMMEEAGRKVGAALGPLKTIQKPRPVIGIFVHSASWLAHIQTMHQSLKGLRDRPYDITVYFFDGYNETAETQFREIGVNSVFVSRIAPQGVTGFFEKLKFLRTQCEADGVQAMIWLCLSTMKGFAFGMRLAPRQIYWCMKHNVGAFTTVDDYFVSFNIPTETVDLYGKTWKGIPVSYTSSVKPAPGEVDRIRTQYGADKIFLGTIGREDKLNSPPFLEALTRILQEHPNTIYLYPGHKDLIGPYFAERGLGDRVHFVGWVDPRTYAEVFDIYLDSWPARSGQTAFNAFEASKPYVACVGDTGNHPLIGNHYGYMRLEKDEAGVFRMVDRETDQIFDREGERCLLVGEGIDEYVALVSRLIADPEFRTLCGEATYEFSLFLADENRVAAVLDKHLRDNLHLAKDMAA